MSSQFHHTHFLRLYVVRLSTWSCARPSCPQHLPGRCPREYRQSGGRLGSSGLGGNSRQGLPDSDLSNVACLGLANVSVFLCQPVLDTSTIRRRDTSYCCLSYCCLNVNSEGYYRMPKLWHYQEVRQTQLLRSRRCLVQ